MGVSEKLHALALETYDRMIGLVLDEFGFTGENARKGVPAPVQAGKRWVVERTHTG